MSAETAAPTIAVVNDDSEFLRLMGDLLTLEGYASSVHTNGAAALPNLRASPPDLAIVDIRLERPDAGWDLLQMLRLDPALRALPIIVCSADVRFLRDHEARLRDLGIAVLAKPFDIDELLALIRAGLAGGGDR